MTPWPEPPGELRALRSGDGGPTVVLVHGFTQTHVSWAPVAADLAADHRVVAVDAPGHGKSADITADLVAGAALLGRVGSGAASVGGESERRAIYVGYSMGGRLALRLALDRPELVAGLVLLGATAGIDNAAGRAARRASDEALADRIEGEGVAAFLDAWLAQPLFADLRPTPEDLAARHANSPSGLASSLRLAGTGTMEPPWWDELPSMAVPTLVLAGERDEKFAALGHRLADSIGLAARFSTVPGTGHPAHLQEPMLVADLVRRFAASSSRRLPH